MKKEVILSVYYMRLLAIVLIVNSHFNEKYITEFNPFALYGYLGNFGNMIFFFISAYVLTLGFKKYESQKFRWIIYRLTYLLIIILSIKAIAKIFHNEIPNLFEMVIDIFNSISFISMMLYLSMLFPFLYLLLDKLKIYSLIILTILSLSLPQLVHVKVIHFVEYLLIFILGMVIAEKGIVLPFKNRISIFVFLVICALIFLIAKLRFDYMQIIIFSKIFTIYFLFLFLEKINFKKIPEKINQAVITISTLSLYIYLTHFYFIDISYKLSKSFGLFIVFIIITPICFLEKSILNKLVVYSKKIIIKDIPVKNS